ncbi:hypothetical protein HX882_07835 [Pseudomonas gingeri]|uniref:Uncharacterized protein n=1 Tax=Pseudomonas gingeri TaxID=117681 RepID=A0A7Y8C1C1_9PSED|nr:hypothetical protein [Pseudomonas gingeri]NWB95793.1 hypothetical protein [Pseudomonas gingeri]
MEFSPLRKIAIRLACVHAEDRDWVLARLEPGERREVDALLEEISQLGLADDPTVLAAMLGELASPPVAEPVTADSARLKAVLANARHPFWAGLVLQLETPALRREVLGGLANSAGVRRWDTAFAKQPLPPALVNCLKNYLEPEELGDERT